VSEASHNDSPVYAWEFGTDAERLVFDTLQADGWSVLPAGDAGVDGAGMLTLPGDQARLPDILGWHEAVPRWVEVKAKGQPIRHTKSQQLRHGINRNAWNDYRRVAGETGVPVELVVVESDRHSIAHAPLSELSVVDTTDADQADDFGSDMVFFDRQEFAVIVEVTRFDGETFIDGEPVDEADGRVFGDLRGTPAWTPRDGGEMA